MSCFAPLYEPKQYNETEIFFQKNTTMITYIIIMAVCLLLSATFSATETAFSTFNKTRIRTLAEKEENKRAQLVLDMSEKYDRLLSTILIGNNIVNIILASLGTLLFVNFLIRGNEGLATTASTAVITVLVLIFGEITPKNLAKDFPEKFTMFIAPFIRAMMILLAPFVFLFSLWKKLLSKMFKKEEDTKMSQEELLMMVEEVQQEGSIDDEEGELLRNVIEFTDLRAEDILTHRVDLEAFSVDATREEIAERFARSQFSRLLVYEENIDHIVGVIHQKDFYTEAGRSVTELMKPPVFIHQTEKISELLKTLQSNKSHIAVVVDEYGGTLGIVTMEDILEELVGEIWDEHDEVVETIHEIDETHFRVDAGSNLADFLEYFSIKSESESVSVGGWVMEQLNKIADEGDAFRYENLLVTVEKTDAMRVTEVLVERLPEESEEDEKDRDAAEEEAAD